VGVIVGVVRTDAEVPHSVNPSLVEMPSDETIPPVATDQRSTS
jgi:hypothetical protein